MLSNRYYLEMSSCWSLTLRQFFFFIYVESQNNHPNVYFGVFLSTNRTQVMLWKQNSPRSNNVWTDSVFTCTVFPFTTTSCLLPVQVARFPFQKLMSLLVVMPLSGQVNVSSLSAKLNVSDLYNRLPKERAVQVKVPKFKLEYAQELQDVFTKLGMS